MMVRARAKKSRNPMLRRSGKSLTQTCNHSLTETDLRSLQAVSSESQSSFSTEIKTLNCSDVKVLLTRKLNRTNMLLYFYSIATVLFVSSSFPRLKELTLLSFLHP